LLFATIFVGQISSITVIREAANASNAAIAKKNQAENQESPEKYGKILYH